MEGRHTRLGGGEVWGPSLDNYIETLVFYIVLNLYAIRPKTRKTRALAQHGMGGAWPGRHDLFCDVRSVPKRMDRIDGT
jgi:hypothetical protein